MEGGLRGLVVIFSAMMIQVLAFGNYAIIGIYIVYFLDIFRGNAVGVSLISAVHFATLLGFGPLVSFMMTKISYRKLCLAGAALVSVGVFCTPFIVSLPAMYIFFGVFAGIGGCLIYIPSHVLSGMYYDKYRALAVGVATSGTALGGTVMPLVVGTLIEEYTWKGSLIMLAALDTHLFIFAMFMIPPPDPPEHQNGSSENVDIVKTKTMTTFDDFRSSSSESCDDDVLTPEHCADTQESAWLADEGGGGDTFNTALCDNLLNDSESKVTFHASDPQKRGDIPSHLSKSSENVANRGTSSNCSTKTKRPSSFVSSSPADDITRILAPSYVLWSPFWVQGIRSRSRSNMGSAENSAIGEIEDNNCEPASTLLEANRLTDTDDNQQHGNDEDCESASSFRKSLIVLQKIESWTRNLKDHVRLLSDFRFIVYCISTLVWGLTTSLFLTFAPKVIVLKGFSPYTAAFLFTYFGVGQLIGCILISIFGNFFGKRMLLFILSNVFTGVFMILVPQMCSYLELAIMLVLEGVAYGCILGLYMSVTIDLIGVQDLDVGFGYVVFFSGIGCFLGPPIGGAMSEVYGQYDEAFYLSGLLTVVGGGLIMLLIYLPFCRLRS